MKKRLVIYIFFTFIGLKISIAQNWDTKVIKLGYITDYVYSPKIDRFLVALEDRIILVNPHTGVTVDSIVVGGKLTQETEIYKIAVSSDAEYIYFVKRSDTKIYRYKLANKTKDIEINIGETVLDMDVMPGNSKTLAVLRRAKGNVVIFDNVTMRPQPTEDVYSALVSINFSSSDTTVIYGGNRELIVMKVNSLGATIASRTYTMGDQFDGRFKQSPDGFIYSHSGSKLRFRKDKTLIHEGKYGRSVNYALMNTIGSQYFVPDPIENKVYCLIELREVSKATDSTQIAIFNKETFNLDTIFTLPIILNKEGYQKEMIEWGSSKLAITFNDKLIIFRRCISKIIESPIIVEGAKIIGCQDSTVTLTASGNFNRYLWSNGDTGKIIKVTKYLDYIQYFSVAASDSEGCLSPYSKTTRVTFESTPYKPIIYVVDSKTSACKGDSINLALSSYSGNEKVVWSNGDEGNSIWVKQSGSFTVQTISTNGCKSLSSDIQKISFLDFEIPPRPTIKIEKGDSILCEGGTITLSAPSGFVLYKWSNGSNERVTTIAPNSSGDVTVRVFDSNGCESSPSLPIYLKLNYKPYITPKVTLNNGVLASSQSKGNQWYLNGVAIQGATNQFYKPQQAGYYAVKYIENGCISDSSNIVQF